MLAFAAIALQFAISLSDIVPANAKVEKIAGGFDFVEGPIWTRGNELIFSDEGAANRLYRWSPKDGKVTIFRTDALVPNGNTLDRQGRLVTCEQAKRRVARTERDGSKTVLASTFEGKRFNSPNDVVVRRNGQIYFTDPPYGVPAGESVELGFNGVFQIRKDGTVHALAKDFQKPNGLAFSPDEKVLYVDDTERGTIRAFSVLPDGSLTGDRVFAELRGPGDGAPDGMKVDVRGNVYCTGPGGIWVFAPNGTKLGVIQVPEAAANCGWGDRDFRTLFITARTSLYRIRLNIPGIRP